MRHRIWIVLLLLVPVSLWAQTVPLYWDAPDQGVPTTYIIERQPAQRVWQMLAVVPAPTRIYEDQHPLRGEQCYRVVATNATAVSPPSDVVCARCTGNRCRPL